MFLSNISPLPEHRIQEINVYISQGEENYSDNYFPTNISDQESLFKKSYLISLVYH